LGCIFQFYKNIIYLPNKCYDSKLPGMVKRIYKNYKYNSWRLVRQWLSCLQSQINNWLFLHNMICLCINNLHEVVVFQCISTLYNVSILYYSMRVLTPVWGTAYCHNSLLRLQGCNRKEGCIVPYSDQSTLVHHTYDGYAKGNTLLILKQVTEVFHDHSFPESNHAHKLQFTLWTGVPKILK